MVRGSIAAAELLYNKLLALPQDAEFNYHLSLGRITINSSPVAGLFKVQLIPGSREKSCALWEFWTQGKFSDSYNLLPDDL